MQILKQKLKLLGRLQQLKYMLLGCAPVGLDRPILVSVGAYNENTGGIVVLYMLVDYLNRLGADAYVYPYCLDEKKAIKFGFLSLWGLSDQREIAARYSDQSGNTPVWLDVNVGDAIVVYPEIIAGNPANAVHVVRWFLHKPGFHTGVVDYGDEELYFYYKKTFNDWGLNPHEERCLFMARVLKDIYYPPKDRQRRVGECCVVHKGQKRELEIKTEGMTMVDGLTHAQAAEVFRISKRCYCYDLDTMYARYAALCGCEVVIVPDAGMSVEEWRPDAESRYGLAYGDSQEQLEWAAQTRSSVLESMMRGENQAEESVLNFLKIVRGFAERERHLDSESHRAILKEGAEVSKS